MQNLSRHIFYLNSKRDKTLELFKEKYELPIPNKIIAEIASDIDFEFAFNNAKSYHNNRTLKNAIC